MSWSLFHGLNEVLLFTQPDDTQLKMNDPAWDWSIDRENTIGILFAKCLMTSYNMIKQTSADLRTIIVTPTESYMKVQTHVHNKHNTSDISFIIIIAIS